MDTSTTLRRLLMAGAGVTLLGGIACTHETHAVRQVTVRYGDLNLDTQSGASVLYGRIGAAARAVCGREGRSLGEQREWETCYHLSVSDAVEAVQNALLSALNGPSAGTAHGARSLR